MSETSEEIEKKLDQRLLQIHKRLEWISNAEARSAWVKGAAAQGSFLKERERLLDEAEKIVDQLMTTHA